MWWRKNLKLESLNLAPKWKYDSTLKPPAPTIGVEVGGERVELIVDTGFSGEVLIPFRLFEHIGLTSFLVPYEYSALMPDSRRIKLYTASATLTLGSKRYAVKVHSSQHIDRRIVGRGFLNRFVSILNGPRKELAIEGPG